MENIELWKPVTGYEKYYEISSFGRFKQLPRPHRGGKLLKERITMGSGSIDSYKRIMLTDEKGERKFKRVHQIVASEFILNKDNKFCVNHIDGNKSNNIVSNLEWSSSKENNEHARVNGLMPLRFKYSVELINEIKKSELSNRTLSIKHNIAYRYICLIRQKDYTRQYIEKELEKII